MQPRLARSHTDKMLAGVCGGLGEYFNIDPVIVRLIFVLVTMTSGLGIPIYLVLWIVMPRSAPPAGGYQPSAFQQPRSQAHHAAHQSGAPITYEETGFEQELREVRRAQVPQQAQQQPRPQSRTLTQEPPLPGEYPFDPQTGRPIQPNSPATGETINLNFRVDAAEARPHFTPPADATQPAYGMPPRRRRNWRTLGFVLVGIGGLILLEQIGVSMTFVFPALLILAGIILLRRR